MSINYLQEGSKGLMPTFAIYISAEAHKKYGGMGTILVIKVSLHLLPHTIKTLELFHLLILIVKHLHSLFVQVSAESAYQFGELVADPVTKELLHYTEKPETFVCLSSEIHV